MTANSNIRPKIRVSHKRVNQITVAGEWARTLSVPAARPIKPVYVRMFLALIDGD